MSQTSDRPVPPVGEEIHMPAGSLQPLGLSVGLTLSIVGITTSIVIVIAGVILSLAMIYGWIRDARREFDELPGEHSSH